MKDHYAVNPPPGALHRFDARVHYPFGKASGPSIPDIVYQTVPVVTPTKRQLFQSTVTGAGTPPELDMSVGSGVPKNPICRRWFRRTDL